MAQKQETHPLSFLASAFGAGKYPTVGLTLGTDRMDNLTAWVKQSRGSLPDIFHTVTWTDRDPFSHLGSCNDVTYRLNSNVAGENRMILPEPFELDDRNDLIDKIDLLITHCQVG